MKPRLHHLMFVLFCAGLFILTNSAITESERLAESVRHRMAREQEQRDIEGILRQTAGVEK